MIESTLCVVLSGSKRTRLLKQGIAGHMVEIVAVSLMADPCGRSSRSRSVRSPPYLGVRPSVGDAVSTTKTTRDNHLVIATKRERRMLCPPQARTRFLRYVAQCAEPRRDLLSYWTYALSRRGRPRRRRRARRSTGAPERRLECVEERHPALVEHALLNDLVCPQQDGLGNRQPEVSGCLQIDDQLELRWVLDGQIRGLRAFENLVHVRGRPPEVVWKAHPVGHEPTSVDPRLPLVHRGQAIPGHKVHDLSPVGLEHQVLQHQQCAESFSGHCRKSPVQLIGIGHADGLNL